MLNFVLLFRIIAISTTWWRIPDGRSAGQFRAMLLVPCILNLSVAPPTGTVTMKSSVGSSMANVALMVKGFHNQSFRLHSTSPVVPSTPVTASTTSYTRMNFQFMRQNSTTFLEEFEAYLILINTEFFSSPKSIAAFQLELKALPFHGTSRYPDCLNLVTSVSRGLSSRNTVL